MPGRTWTGPITENHRYSFNGKEQDHELKGDGNSIAYELRIYDSRLVRWLSTDPLQKEYASLSPYNFAENSPIRLIDIGGEGPGDPLHHEFLMSVAIEIYDAAKSQGASGKGALLVMAQASIESGYGGGKTKKDFNLFGFKFGGKRIDFSNKGGYTGAINEYFRRSKLAWPGFIDLLKRKSFTSDEIDQVLYTGKYFEKAEERNLTGHLAYNNDDISADETVNNNQYGTKLTGQMVDFRARIVESIDYQLNKNNERIGEIQMVLKNAIKPPPYSSEVEGQKSNISKEESDKLSAEMKGLVIQNTKLEKVKKDISN